METWHNRLDQALAARRKTWSDLVEVTGLKKPSVYAWKPDATKRSSMMNGDNAATVCSWLQISPMWLFHNEGPSGLEGELLSDVALKAAAYLTMLPPESQIEILHYLRIEATKRKQIASVELEQKRSHDDADSQDHPRH